MFKRIEAMIIHSQAYNALRYAAIPNWVVETLTKVTRRDKQFYASFLSTPQKKLVFDVGANKGNKTRALLELGCDVIAVEPEFKSLRTLQYRFGNNKRVKIVEKGLSDKPGKATIHIAAPRSGFNTLSDKWVGILGQSDVNRFEKKIAYSDEYEIELSTLDELIKTFGLPYFIKIDVEGYELNVLKGLTQAPDFISFETNLPEFLDETKQCLQQLLQISPTASFNYSIAESLVLPNWISGEALTQILTTGGLRYMEIICRMKNS